MMRNKGVGSEWREQRLSGSVWNKLASFRIVASSRTCRIKRNYCDKGPAAYRRYEESRVLACRWPAGSCWCPVLMELHTCPSRQVQIEDNWLQNDWTIALPPACFTFHLIIALAALCALEQGIQGHCMLWVCSQVSNKGTIIWKEWSFKT